MPEPLPRRSWVGSRWRGASGDVITVLEVDARGVVHGQWDSGIPWHVHVGDLKMYVEVDGGPVVRVKEENGG